MMYVEPKYIIKINKISFMCRKPVLKKIFLAVQLFLLRGPPIADP